MLSFLDQFFNRTPNNTSSPRPVSHPTSSSPPSPTLQNTASTTVNNSSPTTDDSSSSTSPNLASIVANNSFSSPVPASEASDPVNSPTPPPQNPSAVEVNSIKKQFSFFEIKEDDFDIVKSNKEQITKLMKMLDKKGFLVAASFKDFVQKRAITTGRQGTVYQVVEKKEYASHLNPDGSYYGGQYLAVKAEDFFLTNPLEIQIKPRELELMTDKFHKSAIHAEKVFFEHDLENLKYSVFIVMPWFRHTLMSWLLKKNDNKGNISEIKNNKRTVEEVRRMLISILEGISMIHNRRNAHMDIKFDNILVDEYMNDSEDDNGEIKPLLISEPIIADFGMVKDLTKKSSSSSLTGFTVEYAPLELFPPSKPSYSSKTDIFSFGVILYKIFIDENEGSFRIQHSKPNFEINSENIKKRIEILFPKDKDTISESIIEDIAKIINNCLEDNPASRPQAITLLLEHEFFKLSQEDRSKISDFEIENTYEYGLKLLEGKHGYPKDLKKAREIFERLSNSFNHSPSKFIFGFMICWGLGGNRNMPLGNETMEQSATTAMTYFGTHYDDSLGFSEFAVAYMHYSGRGVPRDFVKAHEFFQKSADKANSFAQRWISFTYLFGRGVEKNTPLAFDLCKKSALQGNCVGQSFLGYLFHEGLPNPQKDYKEALKWRTLSADQGFSDGQNSSGFHYDKGLGVPIDKEKAVYYYKLAAEQGFAPAQFNYAEKLEFGEGTPKDLDAAIMWYKKAYGDAYRALVRLKIIVHYGFMDHRDFL